MGDRRRGLAADKWPTWSDGWGITAGIPRQQSCLRGRLRQRPQLREQNSAGQSPAGRAPAVIAPRSDPLALTRPDALIEGDRVQLKALLANCPELDALAEHVRTFAHMVTDLHGDQLPEWIESARITTDLPGLSRFAQHLERDLDAVAARLTLPWNFGVVEGHVNRIKRLKRQMFRRAGFELL
ncbi:hypothetical protein [Streptomyces sp. NPDC001410]|uniref:hypothetical protein n=1 Tax=Streptomyces sp. NPDC001410 TaxID=3364574 RepID=UPI0036C96249